MNFIERLLFRKFMYRFMLMKFTHRLVFYEVYRDNFFMKLIE